MTSVSSTPRTWKQVQDHPAVESVEYTPGDDVKYWIYLRSGFSIAMDPGSVHTGNGATIREAILDTFPVVPCRCRHCVADETIIAQGEGS